MQQLNELNAIAAECDRVTKGMLDGSVGRDDGLFATAATLQRLVVEFTQFVAYALPIVHTMHQAMIAAQTAQAQAAQAQQAAAQQAQATPQAPAEPPPANVVPINQAASTEIQTVEGAPRTRP
jgi:hypothetical protein